MTWKLIKKDDYDEDNNDDDDDDDDDDSSNNISAFLIKRGCPMQYVRNDYNGLLVRNNCCINKVNHPVCWMSAEKGYAHLQIFVGGSGRC